MNPGSTTDESLMAALATGEERALEALMTRYQKDIFRFCLHYLKDVERSRELTQETFIRVFTASQRFDDSRKFKPWVLCIARNLCLNEIKRRKTVPMESLDEYAEGNRANSDVFRSDGPTPSHHVATAERHALIAKALESLDDDAREIVELKYFEHMSAKEIADIIGSTEGAVRTKLHRIMVTLRKGYQDCRDDL
jgi:RNA polymerase sigma-70 factor (ECF subfamily)